MEQFFRLAITCGAILLISFVYVEIAQFIKRRLAKSEDEIIEDSFPWPSHRP